MHNLLEEQARHFREIFEYMPVAYQSLDIEGFYLDANDRMAHMLGYDDPTELIGKCFGDFWSDETSSQFPPTFGGLKQSGQVNRDLFLKRRDGSTLIAQISGCTQRTVNGEFVRTHCALLDVSERRAMEAQLLSLNESLEARVAERTTELIAAQAARRNFLAVVSHELRTPLNSIINLANLLGSEKLTPDGRETANRLNIATESLLKLIDGILDFSGIDAQEVILDQQPFRLNDILNLVRNLFADAAAAKGLGFEVTPFAMESILLGDQQRLSQVLINLVANAIKFTKQGEVALVVTQVLRHEESVRLRFAVRDTGCGIDPAQLKTIFEPFIRGNGADGSFTQGVGLGLAICKQLVDLMGAQIFVTSSPATGSTFWFEVDFNLAGQKANTPLTSCVEEPDSPYCPRILLAEDDDMNRYAIERVLSRRGCQVVTATDGEAALSTLEDLAARGETPDVIVLDLEMPRMNGLETIREIRKAPTFSALPILVLSGNPLSSRQAEVMAAGASAFLYKPINPTALMAAIRQHHPPIS